MEYGYSGIYRTGGWQVFFKIHVLKNFTIFRVFESLLNKAAGLKAYNFVKKRLWHGCFPVNIARLLRAAFFILNISDGCFRISYKTCWKQLWRKFFSEISKKLFLSLCCSVSKITPLQVFHSFCLSLNMSEVYLGPSQTSRWSLLRK